MVLDLDITAAGAPFRSHRPGVALRVFIAHAVVLATLWFAGWWTPPPEQTLQVTLASPTPEPATTESVAPAAPPTPTPPTPSQPVPQPTPTPAPDPTPKWRPRSAQDIRQNATLEPVQETTRQQTRPSAPDLSHLQQALRQHTAVDITETPHTQASSWRGDSYAQLVHSVMYRKWTQPRGRDGDAARVRVRLAPDGRVLSARVIGADTVALRASAEAVARSLTRLPPPSAHGFAGGELSLTVVFEIGR